MLFNTLANLRVLITLDPPRAQAMLDRLIGYLRATLGASRSDTHPLSVEFALLDDYLALMALRMGARLQVQLDLPESLRALPVPPLLLQPLVENSIRHGLEPKVAGGRVEVRAAAQGDRLLLTVRDTGVGLAASLAPADGGALDGSGYGTGHVAERLDALYGARARFTLRPADDREGGTLAEVNLPLPTAPVPTAEAAAGTARRAIA
jgi:sensor histidine kinase YesM